MIQSCKVSNKISDSRHAHVNLPKCKAILTTIFEDQIDVDNQTYRARMTAEGATAMQLKIFK
jgi:hypothetical protein